VIATTERLPLVALYRFLVDFEEKAAISYFFVTVRTPEGVVETAVSVRITTGTLASF